MAKPKETPLHSLLQISSSLAKQLELLRDDKKRENIPSDEVFNKVKECIQRLEQWDDKAQGLIVDSKKMVWEKLAQTIQQQFIKYDQKHKDEYNKLVESSIIPRFTSPEQEPTKQQEDSSNIISDDDQLFEDFEGKFNQLCAKEKECLYWFSLFPKGTAIKRKELIWWWEESELLSIIDSHNNEGDEILGKLHVKGFIQRDKSNKSVPVTYTLHGNIWLDVRKKASEWCEKVCVLEKRDKTTELLKPVGEQGEEIDDTHLLNGIKIYIMINISANKLGKDIRKPGVGVRLPRILLFGSWKHGEQMDYIEVEDLDLLISHWCNKNEVRYLSLRGITGIVKLSKNIYDIGRLRFLDLRACNNLESIPEGIERLTQLVHLDLSECYLLDQVPKGIAKLYNLQVLKGFVIKQDPPKVHIINNNNSTNDHFGDNTSSCTFRDLSQLKLLRKLTIRTRRMNFPTSDDLHTLSTMIHLNSLGIKWVTSSTSNNTTNYNANDHQIHVSIEVDDDDDSGRFPPNLEKLDLQAMPEQVKNRVFGRIRETSISLRKLSIRGGHITDLGPLEYCFEGVEFVRLRYLHQLSMTWNEFIHSFPNLTRLEMHQCPRLELMSFPCDIHGVFQRAP